jgi:hypothetical protein
MDAATIESKPLISRFHNADDLGLCPECGAVMEEKDRLREGPFTYIWLACSKIDCDGQWMQKKPNRSLVGV